MKEATPDFTPKAVARVFNPDFEKLRQWWKPEYFLIAAKEWCDRNPDRELIIGYKEI